MMRIYCETYGCTANRADSEVMLGLSERAGFCVVDDIDQADVVIVNTCSVKGTTHKRMLRRLSRLTGNEKLVVVAGCLPLIDLKSVERVGKFDAIISCKSIASLPDVLERLKRGEKNLMILDGSPKQKPDLPKKRFSEVSAPVQIAEGCTSRCTYCSVKLARGWLKSFDPDRIVCEIRTLVGRGYREIQLTAQDVAAYGLDGGVRLPELLQRVVSIPGEFRVRVGMMNPKNVLPILDELVEIFRHEHVYKFLHLPVQSGSNRVLSAMRREYTVEELVEIVRAFRRKIQNLYLCTDVIVGFPGEEEEDFQLTRDLLEEVRPDKTNISKFSPMPGTEAANLPKPDGREIAARSRELALLCRRLGWQINREYLGREVGGFVVEVGEKGGFILRSENYKQIILERANLGEFLRVRIVEASPTYLKGEPV